MSFTLALTWIFSCVVSLADCFELACIQSHAIVRLVLSNGVLVHVRAWT